MTERTLVARDGTRLHVAWHVPTSASPGALLVMIHGFSAHAGLYQETAAFFAARGFVVCAFDARGHGRSSGRRGHVRRFADYRSDLRLVVDDVRARYPDLPLVLLGHSQGGTVALDFALATHAEIPLAALVLICPFLKLRLEVPRYKLWLSPILNVLWPSLALGNELAAEDVARQPDTRKRVSTDPLIHHVATPRWFQEVRSTQAALMASASKLRTPTWIGMAGDDRIVCNDAIRTFARAAGPGVEVRVYEGGAHEILLDAERGEVRSDIATWVVGRLSTPYNSNLS